MTRSRRLLLACALVFGTSLPARAQAAGGADRIEQDLRALVTAAGSTMQVDAAGLTSSGRRIWAIEPVGDPGSSRRRLVLVGGLDGRPDSTAAVMRILQWWSTDREAAVLRNHWQLAAIPCARPDLCAAALAGPPAPPLAFPPEGGFFDGTLDPTPHHLWRWTTLQGPTLVVEIRVGWPLVWEANALAVTLAPGAREAPAGSLASALGTGGAGAIPAGAPALTLTARSNVVTETVRDLMRRSAGAISPLRTAMVGRSDRPPLDVARLLARRYPVQPIMSYIPGLSWSGALRLTAMTGDASRGEKAIGEMTPFVAGARPAIAEPYLLTSLAGHLAFADWGSIGGNRDAAALARQAADFILPQAPTEIVRFARGWTDDMFMATSVLARVAAQTNEDRYAATVGRLLTTYVADLQRPDGLFIHAKEGPHAWGRGNGFAVFGLMDALTYLPTSWPERAVVLRSYQALVRGVTALQAPDGMWRQVIDEPGSYRELTVTAMLVAATARGLRLGWLDASYRPLVDRAWQGLLRRVAEDGTLIDVCTGTGSGVARDYYLNRAALSGPDDRGGAMALTAAIEMEELAGAGTRR